MELSLNFTNPNLISTSALRPDTLMIKILQSDFFVDINDYQRVQTSPEMSLPLPA
jgi:hypothetical protein